MSATLTPPLPQVVLPDHTQLPESDGTFVTNFDEHPQAILLTDSLGPILHKRHPDGQYCIGQNSGIYWHHTTAPLEGARAPDWFYVPGVPPRLDGKTRRSYVLWQELKAPLVLMEFASGDGAEERDRTPMTGKFWIYEQVIRAPYYVIFEIETGRLEVHRLVDGQYFKMQANARGRYSILPLGIELGVWHGRYQNIDGHWMRWWDEQGNLLPIGTERADAAEKMLDSERRQKEQAQRQTEKAQQQAEQERLQKEQAQEQLDQLRRKLNDLGIDLETK